MKRGDSTWIERAASGALLIATLFANPCAHADDTRLIQLQHRPAAEVIPLIQPLLGQNDAISGTDYRLIIRTSEKNFTEIERLLAQLDIARRQLRITVRQTAASDSRTSNTGVSGQVGNNPRIQIQRNVPAEGRGGVIGNPGNLRLETQTTTTTARADNTQFITVLDGAHAFVRVGQSIAHTERVLILTGRQAILSQGIAVQDIVTGFDIVPHVQPQGVQVDITPRLSSLQNPTTGLANFQEYSTSVVVKPGEWIEIGGLSGNGADVRRAILDSRAGATDKRGNVFLKIE